jgi:two-component system response regulator RegA
MTTPLPALVADDTAVARLAVVRALKARGIAAVEAASAAAGKVFDPNAIACALLDLDLGDGTGVEVARALLATRPDLPIAFFSAGAEAHVLAEANALGRVFHKPDELALAIAWVAQHVAP